MRKFLLSLFLLAIPVLYLGSTSYATGTVDAVVNASETTEQSPEEEEEENSSDSWDSSYDFTAGNTVASPVTMEQAEQKVREKGGEVLSLVQTIAAYIIAIITVIGVVCLAVGFVGKKDTAKGIGFGVLIVCAIAYVLVFIGPWLLDWFRAWAIS